MWGMESALPNIQNYLSYYHLTLSVRGSERYMGRVNHLQIIKLPGELNQEGISDCVRFYDGSVHRELVGRLCPCEDGGMMLDMGQGKSYRFNKQSC